MSRRGKNEGSIYQREDGRWVSVISDGYQNGKRRRKSIYGATRKEVQEELARALRSQQLGLPVESDRLTVGTWLKQWLKQQEPPATRPKSRAVRDLCSIRTFQRPSSPGSSSRAR